MMWQIWFHQHIGKISPTYFMRLNKNWNSLIGFCLLFNRSVNNY